jgi:hypothetical protein
VTPLQKVMNELDAALTGKSVERVLHDTSPGPATVEDWIAQSGHNLNWYLSDDGLSRVVFSTTNRNLFLTHNSTERVRMRWESARPQIEAAERYLSQELDRIYGRSVGEAVVEALLGEAIAVDLDGTLAKDSGWKGPEHIGEPVKPMLDLVKKLIDDGEEVVIFTARAHDGKKSTKDYIRDWLKDHDLPDLEITNEKRPDMEKFYDDKAVAVEKNKGVTESVLRQRSSAGRASVL